MPKHKIVRDPDNLRERLDLKRPAPGRKLAVGLDLGTTTGLSYCWFDPGAPWPPPAAVIHSGQLDLSVGDYDSGALRFVRFRQFLSVLDPDLVAFEDVRYTAARQVFGPHPSPEQVIARVARPIELFGSFKGILATFCEERDVPCVGFSIATIKRRAASNGNANKEAVIAAANAEFAAGLAVEDYEKLGTDNIADSIFVLALGLEQYSRGFAPAEAAPAATPPPRNRPKAARKS